MGWFAELNRLRGRDDEKTRKWDIVDTAIEVVETRKQWGSVAARGHYASKNVFRRCQKVPCGKNILLTTHLAESSEEREMFRDRSAPC